MPVTPASTISRPARSGCISYGVDLQMLVDSTKNRQDSTVQTGKIVKGVLTVTRKHVFSQDYVAENKSDHDKTLIIEHPLRQGWTLVDTDKPIETTETLYRFKGTRRRRQGQQADRQGSR